MTKLSSDRLIRVQQKTQSMLELANENEGLLLKLTDTIATITKIKKTNEIAIMYFNKGKY